MSLIDSIHLLEAITRLIVAMAWPLLVGVVIYIFRSRLTAFLDEVHEVEFWGVKARVRKELNKAAEKAASTLSSGPSKDELSGAANVAELAKQDVALVRQQVDMLAIEYDNLRGSMPSGDERTGKLEKVVSKMRTIGQAAYGIRYELAASPSPGRRLQAVACLQMLPDYELLDWLARRVGEKKRFIAYHALIALIAATGGPLAREHLKEIEIAAVKSGQGLPEGSDRWNAWCHLNKQIVSLRERRQ